MKRSAIGPIVMALAIAMAGVVAYAQAAADSKAFVNDLTIAGLAEVQLGKLAAEHGSSPDVKSFGQMMVKDHTQAANELKPIATELKVQQPTQPAKAGDSGYFEWTGASTQRGSWKLLDAANEELAGETVTRTSAAPLAPRTASMAPSAPLPAVAPATNSGRAPLATPVWQWMRRRSEPANHRRMRTGRRCSPG